MMRSPRLPWLLAVALLLAALYPTVARRREAARVMRRLDALARAAADDHARAADGREVAAATASMQSSVAELDPALMVRVDELGSLLSSWQTIGGCGSSGATGSAGIKWIGRGTTGGLFNVQVQGTYSQLGTAPYQERDFFLNTLITRDVGQKWNVGVNLPLVYKYLNDPLMLGGPGMQAIDYSNGGLGDISVQGTHRFGSINDTALTLVLGFPTGSYQETFAVGQPLHQQQQLGFGRVTGALILDHTFDEIWGVLVLGGVASYRGGQNHPLDNYRSPSATGYGYAGYFWGPFVPAAGLTLTGFQRHDRDQTQDENSALFVAAANFSLEWSLDWIAFLAGASIPFQYVGTVAGGGPPPPKWGWGTWLVALGVAVSPF